MAGIWTDAFRSPFITMGRSSTPDLGGSRGRGCLATTYPPCHVEYSPRGSIGHGRSTTEFGTFVPNQYCQINRWDRGGIVTTKSRSGATNDVKLFKKNLKKISKHAKKKERRTNYYPCLLLHGNARNRIHTARVLVKPNGRKSDSMIPKNP